MKLRTITFNAFWGRLTGANLNLPLESRIFHTVCIATLLALIASAGVSISLDIDNQAPLLIGTAVLVCFFYYYSRFKNKSTVCISLYALLSNLFLILNYYHNAGLNGPTLLIFLMGIFMTVAIAPPKQYALWLTTNISVVAGLLLFDYTHPGYIESSYPDQESKYLDNLFSYIIVVLLVFMVTRYIRRSYNEERKAAEVKALELEKVNEKKDKLFSILAHDLSAPLTSIQGYMVLLSEVGLSEEEKNYIQKDLINTTNNTSQILTNLLSWTRAQLQGTSVNLLPLNLSSALSETLRIQQNFARKKGINLQVSLDDEACVVADKDMLELIIRNLISNAIKFSRAGSDISLNARQENNQIIIGIKDNGMGITNAQQSTIFSLKVQPEKGTKNEKGSGLGLLLCKEFAELQNGRIWFDSTPGIGSTFYLSLPCCIEPAIVY